MPPTTTVLVGPVLAGDLWCDERSATTDPRGNATFRLRPGDYQCRTPLGGSAMAQLAAEQHAVVELQLPDGSFRSGRVVDSDGRPIAGALVLLLDPTTPARAHLVAQSDQNGSFRIDGIRGPCHLAATHPEFAPSPPQLLSAVDDRTPCILVLRRERGRCRGIVVDRLGEPMADALVLVGTGDPLRQAVDSRATGTPLQLMRTGADGRFESPPLAPGPQRLLARADGYGMAQTTVQIDLDAVADVRLELSPGATVRGVARSNNGAPVAGAFVWSGRLHAFGSSIATTADDGSFALVDLPAGDTQLTARRPPDLGAETHLTLFAGGFAEWNPTLTDAASGSVRGSVVDPLGRPLVAWQVVATPVASTRGLGTRTAEDGSFAVTGLARQTTVNLAVRRPEGGWTGFPDAELSAVPVDGPPVELTVADSSRARGSLRGSIVGADGRGLAATLLLRHTPTDAFASYATQADGDFRIPAVPPGNVTLDIQAPRYPHRRIDDLAVTAGETLDLGRLQLASGGTVRGILRRVDGLALTNASVRLLDRDDHDAGGAEVTADAYASPDLLPGAYSLLVQADDCAAIRIPVSIASGTDQTIDVDLHSGVQHRFRVATRAAADQQAMTTVLVLDANRPAWCAHLPMQAGVAEFLACLAPGSYVVHAFGVRGYHAEARFEVRTGEAVASTELELLPQPGK